MGDRVYFLTSASASRDFSAPTVTNTSAERDARTGVFVWVRTNAVVRRGIQANGVK